MAKKIAKKTAKSGTAQEGVVRCVGEMGLVELGRALKGRKASLKGAPLLINMSQFRYADEHDFAIGISGEHTGRYEGELIVQVTRFVWSSFPRWRDIEGDEAPFAFRDFNETHSGVKVGGSWVEGVDAGHAFLINGWDGRGRVPAWLKSEIKKMQMAEAL